jgi:methionine-rich copper-binding protein CopC
VCQSTGRWTTRGWHCRAADEFDTFEGAGMRTGWLAAVTGLAAALVLVLDAADAAAHAGYRDASPAAETRVVGTPKYVLVTFTEEIKSIALVVKGPGGVVVTNGEAIINPTDRTNVSVQIHDAGDGRYEVTWDLVSAFDLDTSSGGFGFWVGLPRDGRSLAGEPPGTQAVFRALWGDRAAVEWASEHNAELGPGG